MIDKSFIVSVVILTLLATLAVVFIALYFTKPFQVYPTYAPDLTYTITDAWNLDNNAVYSYTIFNTNSQIRSIGFTMPNAFSFSGLNDISILYSTSDIPYEAPVGVYTIDADGQLNMKNGLYAYNGNPVYYNFQYHTGRSAVIPFTQDQTFTFLFSNSIANESLTFFTSWAA